MATEGTGSGAGPGPGVDPSSGAGSSSGSDAGSGAGSGASSGTGAGGAGGANKPRVLTVTIKDKAVLYAVYMPFLEDGGLFIPTNRTFNLGDEVSMLISFLDEVEKISVTGVVVWITPKSAQGNKAAGVGVHFKGENIKEVRDKIEYYLAGTLKLERPTYTM